MSRRAILHRIFIGFRWGAPLALLNMAVWYHYFGDGSVMDNHPAKTPPVAIAPALQVLPPYSAPGGLDGLSETARRPLFDPTPRAAPAVTKATEDRPDLRAGEIVLLGAAIWGDRRVALLRVEGESHTRTVEGGERVGRATVVLVNADRILLRVGDITQELRLNAEDGGNSRVPLQPLASPTDANGQAAPLPAIDAVSNPITSAELDVASQISEGIMVPNPQ
jgi:hypothetical protein